LRFFISSNYLLNYLGEVIIGYSIDSSDGSFLKDRAWTGIRKEDFFAGFSIFEI